MLFFLSVVFGKPITIYAITMRVTCTLYIICIEYRAFIVVIKWLSLYSLCTLNMFMIQFCIIVSLMWMDMFTKICLGT